MSAPRPTGKVAKLLEGSPPILLKNPFLLTEKQLDEVRTVANEVLTTWACAVSHRGFPESVYVQIGDVLQAAYVRVCAAEMSYHYHQLGELPELGARLHQTRTAYAAALHLHLNRGLARKLIDQIKALETQASLIRPTDG